MKHCSCFKRANNQLEARWRFRSGGRRSAPVAPVGPAPGAGRGGGGGGGGGACLKAISTSLDGPRTPLGQSRHRFPHGSHLGSVVPHSRQRLRSAAEGQQCVRGGGRPPPVIIYYCSDINNSGPNICCCVRKRRRPAAPPASTGKPLSKDVEDLASHVFTVSSAG